MCLGLYIVHMRLGLAVTPLHLGPDVTHVRLGLDVTHLHVGPDVTHVRLGLDVTPMCLALDKHAEPEWKVSSWASTVESGRHWEREKQWRRGEEVVRSS